MAVEDSARANSGARTGQTDRFDPNLRNTEPERLTASAPVERLTFRRTIASGVRALLDMDFDIVHTVAGLVRAPGAMCRDYLHGRGPGPLPVAAAGVYAIWAVTDLYASRRPSVLLRGAIIFAFVLGAMAALLYGVQWYRFSGLG